MLNTVGLVGGLDVHEGHGGGPAGASSIPIIFVMTEDFDALHSTEPVNKNFKERIRSAISN